ncbi:unnamed protein product [Porites lobata]|uniref:WD repeat-containing protein 74 n=1 Tax=Porites lobata TaxID=104759 RepID=A0ABN8PTX2_9CNID|nr:unnamed protein product [Porites lobata]
MADVWVGSETGLLKGVDLKKGSFTNYGVTEKVDRSHAICSMHWVDEDENQILLGLENGIVKTFDVSKGEFVAEKSFPINDKKLKGLFKWENSFVTCVESGLLQIWRDNDNLTDVRVGANVSTVHQNPLCPFQIGTGGQKNDLKLWDLSRPEEAVFKAKNVPNDFLDLQVPVWVTDIGFLPGQGLSSRIAVGTAYHQIRLYDTKTQRRPVLSFDFDEHPVSALAVTDNENIVIVGNTVGTMGRIDLRKGQLQGHYKGFAGGIRCISCLSKQQMVASCGLDKFLRIHHLHSRKLLHKVYLKSSLNCLLLSAGEIEKNLRGAEVKGSTAALSDKSLKRTTDQEEHSDDNDDDDVWNKMDVVTSSVKRKGLQKSKN